MYKLKVKADKEFSQLGVKLIAASKKAEVAIASNAPVVAEAAARIIYYNIEQNIDGGNKNLGAFMAPRTKIEAQYTGNTIILTISGMTEGEAGNPPRADGSEVKVTSPDTNLWLTHEFGTPSDGNSADVNFVKDTGGVTATRKGIGHGVGSPYVGAIARLIRGMTVQLNNGLRGIGGVIAGVEGGAIVEMATGGKVKVDKSAQASMKRAGVSTELLASLGVVHVSVTGRGQINLLGSTKSGGHRFISGKRFGIPTTINR